jgi:hypothetical protein
VTDLVVTGVEVVTVARTIAQIVDSADAVKFDFNTNDPGVNPSGLKTGVLHNPDFASAPVDRVWHEPDDAPGATLLKKRMGLRQVSFRLLVRATSTDNLLAGIGELSELLDAGGIFKWQPIGSTVAYYYDFETGELPQLLRGQDFALQKAFLNYLDTDLPITLYCQPHRRKTRVTSGSPVSVSNDPAVAGARFLTVNVGSGARTAVDLTLAPTAGSVQEIMVAAGKGSGTRFLQGEDSSIASSTEGTNATKPTGDAQASGGSYLAIAGVVAEAPKPRGRWTLTSNVPKGPHLVMARLRTQDPTTWFLQIRYAPFNTNNRAAPYMLPETPFSTNVNGLSVFQYTEIPLGVIDIPDAANALTLDLFARQESGTATTLRVDFLVLVPFEQSAVVTARHQGAVTASGLTMTAIGTGTQVTGTDRAVTTQGSGGRLSLTPHSGRFRATWRYSIESPSGADIFRFSGPGFTHDIQTTTDDYNKTVAAEFDANGTTTYDLDAVYSTKAADSNGTLTLHQVSVEYVPAAATGESFRTKPEDALAFKHDSAGNQTVLLHTAGKVPLWFDPGDNVLYVAPLDIRGQGLSPYLTSVLGRTLDVSYSYAPRET